MIDIADAIIRALNGPRGTEIAKLVLARGVPGTRGEQAYSLNLTRLLRRVARQLSVSVEDLRGPARARAVTDARAVYAYIARKHSSASLATIGRELGGQDHSTVRSAAKRGAALAGGPMEEAVCAVEDWLRNTGQVKGLDAT